MFRNLLGQEGFRIPPGIRGSFSPTTDLGSYITLVDEDVMDTDWWSHFPSLNLSVAKSAYNILINL